MSHNARIRKPALLKGGMIACWIYAATLALFLWMMPILQAMPGTGRKTSGPVPGLPPIQDLSAETLEAMRWFIIPVLLLSIVVAYGLAKDRHWSRWMMMVLLVLGIVLLPPPLANPADYAISAALAVFGWWYLYRKPNVVQYYAAIESPATPP